MELSNPSEAMIEELTAWTLSIRKTAARLRVSERTVGKLISAGRLVVVSRPGGRSRRVSLFSVLVLLGIPAEVVLTKLLAATATAPGSGDLSRLTSCDREGFGHLAPSPQADATISRQPKSDSREEATSGLLPRQQRSATNPACQPGDRGHAAARERAALERAVARAEGASFGG